MADITECAADLVDAHSSVDGNGALLITSEAVATDAYAFDFSANGTSTGTGSSAATSSTTRTASESASASAADRATFAFSNAESSSGDAADAAVVSTSLSRNSYAFAYATAVPFSKVTKSFSEAAVATDHVGTVIEIDVESTGEATSNMGVVVDLTVEDAAAIQALATPGAFIVWRGSSDAAAIASTSISMIANADETSRAVARSSAMVVDYSNPSIWANTERMATAVWKGTPYNSYVVLGDTLIGAGPDGLYAFTTAADDTGPVTAAVTSDLSDMGSTKKKVFDAFTVSAKTSGPIRLFAETEQGRYYYTTDLPSAAYPKTHRAGIGRGLTGRFVRFGMDNQAAGHEGATFAINNIQAGVGDSSRVR